ncbi:MAG: D-tyrosyl-tRNA(Tyr) deacylase [Lachnospiraceae bacterium]|nr:D-tyrosyl-tRNA(Tyr) deacylase [Lachnospiraceae bacterium]
MRAVIQRVKNAQVAVEGELTGRIGQGFLILLGVSDEDNDEDLEYLVRKITRMRIFSDSNGKMNLALSDIGGEILVVSQFTLFADTRKGNRPGFSEAGSPEFSNEMYEKFIEKCRALGFHTEHGIFGADMAVSLINDGPVTIVMDSRNR